MQCMADRTRKSTLGFGFRAYLLEREREEHIEEENLVGPDKALLLRLFVQPGGPLVSDEGIVEAVLTSHVGNDSLQQMRMK